jgi:cytochrome c biogenesis protein CcdA/glutaredoxin
MDLRKTVLIFVLLIYLIGGVFASSVNATFFYGVGCPHCTTVRSYLESFSIQHSDFNVTYLNINENVELIFELYNKFNVPQNNRGAVPILFIGNDFVLGDSSIINQTELLYLKNLNEINNNHNQDFNNIQPISEENKDSSSKTEFSLNSLILLAFADAVNPCELAVLIILMTAILTQYPKNKRKALHAGLAFSLAIFLMYSVFGVLIITGFKFLSNVLNISNTLFFIALALLAIVLGLLNLKDAVIYGGGGFIMEVPQKWRPKMKAIIQGTTSVKGAFITGLIVSLFLTPCTAGPYFVAAGMLATFEWIISIPYFILYMLIFISPMIAITLITYFGFAKVEDMGGWRERNLKKLHLIAGLIMLIIGLMMLGWAMGIISF